MGDIVKLALRLFIFSLVAAVLLAITNEITKGPIEAQKLAAKMDALNKVLPGCEYEQIEYEGIAEDSVLDELFVGKNAAGEIEGYALTASPQGYGGPIPITIGVSMGGYVTQTYVGALQETAGLGSRVGEDAFMDQFIAIAADPDTLRDDVDTIGGATISSSAFVNAVSEMLTYTKNTLAITPNKGDRDAILAANASDEEAEPAGETEIAEGGAKTYDVTGFAPMKVAIEVDADGRIVSVSVPEHSETPGLGADLIADTALFDALAGQDIATAKIDVKSGVTLTSNAINDALKQAAASAEGGAKSYDVTGFAPMKVAIEVDADGKIVSVSVPEHSETPGLGADLIADTAVFDALAGQDIATAKIDVKSGVTLTSNAINDALEQAAAEAGGQVEEETAAPAVPGDPYTVKGMNKFTLYIEVSDGKIVSISAPEHSETPGLGADLLTAEALSALVGMDLAEAKVDVKSGVTLTSNAINGALEQAAAANGIALKTAEPEEAAEPEAAGTSAAPGDPYTVRGMNEFTLYIEVSDGKIVSISAPEHSETPGLGADLLTAEALSALVGMDLAEAKVDVKSGVTLTSNAINGALEQAAAANGIALKTAEPEEAAEPEAAGTSAAPGDPYSVRGMNEFTLYIEVSDGKIVSVSAPEHSETPSFGADLLTAEALSSLAGQDIATAQIDVKSGVTLTSNAINDALKQAAAASGASAKPEEPEATTEPVVEVNEVPAAEEQSATVYEVQAMGMNSKHPFKLSVSVGEDGSITAVTCLEHSETEGGAQVLTDETLSALVGQSLQEAKLDIKTGATVTSNAVNSALQTIAAHVRDAKEVQ